MRALFSTYMYMCILHSLTCPQQMSKRSNARQDSPTSCGISWKMRAMVVLSPRATLCEMAAPSAKPSAKLWMPSPRMMSQASGLMLRRKRTKRFRQPLDLLCGCKEFYNYSERFWVGINWTLASSQLLLYSLVPRPLLNPRGGVVWGRD